MKHLSKFLFVGILLELIVFVLAYVEADGDIVYFFKASARLSGRVSLLFFAILFVYATLYPSVEERSDALYSKFILARNFAVVHIIHWFILAVAVVLSSRELNFSSIAGGSLAYLMIVLLPFIFKRKILVSLSIKWVQHIYLTYVWMIFFITYLSRISGKSVHATGIMPAYQVLFFVISGLMVWRIFMLIRNHFVSIK